MKIIYCLIVLDSNNTNWAIFCANIIRNEQTGKVEYKQVLRTTLKHTDVTVSVTLAEATTGQNGQGGQTVETITASREHPFSVDGKGFVPAGGLAIGNSIVTRAGPPLVVQSVTWNRSAEGYTVYNFEVEDDHSYFVGSVNGGAWVHNYDVSPIECSSYENARNEALQWLKERGFMAEKPTPARFPRETAPNPANGMSTADGKTGFRVEYDETNNAHINVYDGKEKGPHYKFPGNERSVERINRRFRR